MQSPTAASNPAGPYLPLEVTKDRPTLQSVYQEVQLEEALDAALAEAKLRKQRRSE